MVAELLKKTFKKFRLVWHYAKRATETTLTFLTFFRRLKLLQLSSPSNKCGWDDLVKLQMEKIDLIRKLEQDYSEDF